MQSDPEPELFKTISMPRCERCGIEADYNMCAPCIQEQVRIARRNLDPCNCSEYEGEHVHE